MSTYILRKDQRIKVTDMPTDDAITSGVALAMGDSTTQITSDTASVNFMECRFDSGAATGDARGMYLRLYLTAANTGGGEALRAYTNVNANVATARGAHISLDFVATAGGSECSGKGCALSATLHIPNVASWAPTGTYAAIEAEIYSDGSSSDPAGMTDLSFLRVVTGGDATGSADVQDDANLFSIQGFTSAGGNMFYADVPGTIAASLRIKVGSTLYYIPLYSSQDD